MATLTRENINLCKFSKVLVPISKKDAKSEAKPQNGFHCDICPHSFRSEIYLERHKNVAHQSTEHKCEFCHKIFGTKRTLKNHEIQCQNSKALQVYTGKSKVVTEIIKKKVIENDQKVAEKDPKVAENPRIEPTKALTLYTKPNKLVEKGQKVVENPRIEPTKTLALYTKPQKNVENPRIEPTKALTLYTKTNCDRCGRSFGSARGLMTHQRSCKATFNCDKCPAKLETKTQLESHIKYCHDILEEMEREVILYHCDNCDAKFPEKQTLLLHMQFYHVTGPPAPTQPTV